ncbi:MAG: hypothetical protein KDN19_18210 [Verrucomicrobiae bacterium]|nr:hypothetical protein [Verrucomicrobiae bacterium]
MNVEDIKAEIDKLPRDDQESLSRHLRARLHLTPERAAKLFEAIDQSKPEDYIPLEEAKRQFIRNDG